MASHEKAQTLETLRREHSIPDVARWSLTPGGLAVLDVTSEQCDAQLFAHGAHVARWTPAGQRPGLHLSPKSAFEPTKAIRGGVPVCFPWFGARTDDPKPGGKPSPAHGFARTRAWRVEDVSLEDNGRVRVELALTNDAATEALWEASFSATLVATLGQTLSIALEVTNTGTRDFVFEEALHTYLEVGDVALVRVHGLEGTRYVDKVDGGKEKSTSREPLTFMGETDSVFMGTKNAIIVDDPVLRRHLRVDKTGSNTTVVWNPWLVKAQAMPDLGGEAWRSMVCVEAANTAGHAVTLPAGATHTMSTRVSIVPQR